MYNWMPSIAHFFMMSGLPLNRSAWVLWGTRQKTPMRSAGEDLDTHALGRDCICYYASQFEVNGCVFLLRKDGSLFIPSASHGCSAWDLNIFFSHRQRSHYLPYTSMLNYSYIELFGLAELGLKLKSIAAAAARRSVARQWPSISWACVLKYLSRCQSGLAAVPPRVERRLHFTKMEDKCQYVSIFHTPDRASDTSWWTVFPFTFKIKWHLKMQQAIQI